MPTCVASKTSLVALAIAICLSAACRREEPSTPTRPPPVPIERPAIVAPRRIATAASFDLATAPGGAFLAWGLPATSGGGVKAVLLDRYGSVLGADASVYAPTVPPGTSAADGALPEAVELEAASGGGRVGVVWVDRDQGELTLRGSVGDPRAGAFSPAKSFGETARATVGTRGYVALDGSGAGTFLAMLRGVDTRCGSDSADASCGTFALATLTPEGLVARGVPLLVPSPCARAVVGLAAAQGRFHYAVCANVDGHPATTVYSIQEEPQYARADTVLPGCQPEALFAAGGEVIVSGACAGGRAGARLSPGASALRPVSMERLSISCSGDSPVIDSGRDGLRLELAAPESRVESLFPPNVVPPRARAVWTGAALLVAHPTQGEVVIHRYECEEGALRRTDVL